MKKAPLITVITVSYNAVSSIEDTIKSVINQSYKNIEFIIIDGQSTDGTVDIIKKYEKQIAYWTSEPDNGVYDAMNKGIDKSTGEWIIFLGADDILLDNLTILQKYLLDNISIIYGNVIYKNSRKRVFGKYSACKLVVRNIPHQAILYNKSVFKLYKYELQYKIYADYVLNLKCWHDSNITFRYVPVDMSIYNEEGLSSKMFDNVFGQNQVKLFWKYMPWYIAPYAALRKLISKNLNKHIK